MALRKRIHHRVRWVIMTQVEQVIAYMETHNGITSMDAFYEFGITRLAARISDAKKQGYEIESTTEKFNGKYYSRYFLRSH